MMPPYSSAGGPTSAAISPTRDLRNSSITVAKSNSLRYNPDDATLDGSMYSSSRYSAYQPPSSPPSYHTNPQYDVNSVNSRLTYQQPPSYSSRTNYTDAHQQRPVSEYSPRSPTSGAYRGPPGDPRDFRDYRDVPEYGRTAVERQPDYGYPGRDPSAYHRGNGSLPRAISTVSPTGRTSVDPGRMQQISPSGHYGPSAAYQRTNGSAVGSVTASNGYPAAGSAAAVRTGPTTDSMDYDRDAQLQPAQQLGVSATQHYDRVSRFTCLPS